MTLARLLVLASMLAAAAPAADANGKWKLKFLGDPGSMPKMVSEIILDLESDGKSLTGMAHAAHWPGDAPIVDGKLDGDRVSFAFVGKSPWWSKGPKGEASGYPRLTFKGTIEGDRMKVRLVWDSVMIYGDVENAGRDHELAGERVSSPKAAPRDR